jgi:hypothetical protein
MTEPTDSHDKEFGGHFIWLKLTNRNTVTGQININGYPKKKDLDEDMWYTVKHYLN